MSVSQKHVIMIGVDIGYENNDSLYDELEPYIEGTKELDCYFDGMGGKYIIVGKVINEGDEYEGLKLHEINLDRIMTLISEVEDLLIRDFNITIEPKLYSFTHWS